MTHAQNLLTLASFLLLLTLVTSSPALLYYLRKKFTTPKPTPKWSKWGEWESACSATCGIGVRRRYRTCIQPTEPPTKKKIIAPKKLLKKVLKKIVKVDLNKRCAGSQATKAKNCDTKITCPVHGGWSNWESWECTATCGGGVGRKRRSCTNPKPMFNGKSCTGDSVQAGSCNEHLCPDQIYTLSPKTAGELIDQMATGYNNLEKKPGKMVTLPCKADLLSQVYIQYPDTEVYWLKNGEMIELSDNRVQLTPNSDLVIEDIQPRDNGVYICRMSYGPGVDKPVSLSALTVLSPKPTYIIHEGEPLVLRCNGVHLQSVYRNLSQRWLHNEMLYKDFGNGTPAEWNLYRIDEATKNHTGVWACNVKDLQSKRVWTTNIVHVQVLPERTFSERFLSNRSVVSLIVIVTLTLLLMVGLAFAYAVKWVQTESLEDFEEWKKIVRIERWKAGGSTPEWAMQEDSPLTGEQSEVEEDEYESD